MKPKDLVSKQEIAEMANVHGSAINNWEKRDLGFPLPWGEWPGRIKLWLRSDIEDWFAEREALEEDRRLEKIERLRKQLKELEGK
jgi:hypothetical protein